MKFSEALLNTEALAEQITELVGEDFDGAVGLRGLYKTDNLTELENSHRWEDGYITDEQLRGTSTIAISENWRYDSKSKIIHRLAKYAKLTLQYGDDKIGLIVGEPSGEWGEDIGELIIPNARVIYTWDK